VTGVRTEKKTLEKKQDRIGGKGTKEREGHWGGKASGIQLKEGLEASRFSSSSWRRKKEPGNVGRIAVGEEYNSV